MRLGTGHHTVTLKLTAHIAQVATHHRRRLEPGLRANIEKPSHAINTKKRARTRGTKIVANKRKGRNTEHGRSRQRRCNGNGNRIGTVTTRSHHKDQARIEHKQGAKKNQPRLQLHCETPSPEKLKPCKENAMRYEELPGPLQGWTYDENGTIYTTSGYRCDARHIEAALWLFGCFSTEGRRFLIHSDEAEAAARPVYELSDLTPSQAPTRLRLKPQKRVWREDHHQTKGRTRATGYNLQRDSTRPDQECDRRGYAPTPPKSNQKSTG